MKKKYKYQTGGNNQEDNSLDDSDVFNGILDNYAQLQNQQQTGQQIPLQSAENNDNSTSDYIKNLESFADEDRQDEYSKTIKQLTNSFDQQIANLQQQIEHNSVIDTDDGQQYIEDLYNTQDNTDKNPILNPVTSPIAAAPNGSSTNNYGNIRDTTTGKFKQYATPQAGKQALVNQLNIYKTNKSRTGVTSNSTLYQAMSKYAPVNDHNNPKAYAEFIAKRLGISPNTPISQVDSNKWADAISIMEGNKNIGS